MTDIENANGFIIPTKVNEKKSKYDAKLLLCRVVFQPRSISYKGTVKWCGTINGVIDVYGIETDIVKMGTNGTFNKHYLFDCADKCGVLIRQTENIFEIDRYNGCVKGKRFTDLKEREERDERERYRSNDLVIVMYGEREKVGMVKAVGYLGDIFCYGISFKGKEEEFVYVANDIWGKFFNDDGLINKDFNGEYSVVSMDSAYPKEIGERIDHQGICGTLKWKGKVEGFKCIAIDPEKGELAADFTRHFNDTDAYWAVICLEKFSESQRSVVADKNQRYRIPENYREITNPPNEGFHTYFKIKAYVKVPIENADGMVENYVFDEGNNFRYGIKLDDKEELIYLIPDDVKCASPMDIEWNAFYPINDPAEFGFVTKLEIKDFVRVNPTKENRLKEICDGNIAWMGFDRDCTFKILVYLEKENEEAQGGTFFGQKLVDIEDKRGLLVSPNCIHSFRDPDPIPLKVSEIIEDYTHHRSKIECGNFKGIQGDSNSCYMDTSFFAMFTFQEIFDNLLTNEQNQGNSERKELQRILKSHIIFPLRRDAFVSYSKVSEFRKELEKQFPAKKFVRNERDPEELLETLFHSLTPNDPLFRTYDLRAESGQNCFMLQIFYTSEGKTSKSFEIREMLDLTFLESRILMVKPPKCLILQLPRHGTQYKNFGEVKITPTLDVTHLIQYCKQKCIQCTEERNCNNFCVACSKVGDKLGYLCDDHKSNCSHEKIQIKRKESTFFKGKVELELFAILCIEKTHYVAYVKTREVNTKWVYFDSMATISDKREMTPSVQETDLHDYFSGKGDDTDGHVQRIKNYAFVCFYKNPAMEYYCRDFNHVPSKDPNGD